MSFHRTLSKLLASCPSSCCLSLTQHPAWESGSICSLPRQRSTKSDSVPSHQKERQCCSQDSDILAAEPGHLNFTLQWELVLRGVKKHSAAWVTTEVLALPLYMPQNWSYRGSVGNTQSLQSPFLAIRWLSAAGYFWQLQKGARRSTRFRGPSVHPSFLSLFPHKTVDFLYFF